MRKKRRNFLKEVVLQLEYLAREAQTVDDKKKEEDEIAKEKSLLRAQLEREDWSFRAESSEHIGQAARRFFPGSGRSDGVIVGYLAPEINEGLELWRFEHADGDEEDMDEKDLMKALR